MSWERGAGTAALLLWASGCSAPVPGGDEAPAVTVEKTGDGDLISIESDTIIDGRRPRLTLVCRPGEPAAFRVHLVRAPASPPPPRGVFAQLQVKGGPKWTVELGWTGGATWQARYPRPDQPESDTNDRNNRERIVPILHAFTRERALTLTPPPRYAPAQDIVWRAQTFGPHLAAAQDCAGLRRLPGPGE